jgi:RNA methyltransferase, TrmH family
VTAITSTRNPRVRELAALSRTKVRRERGQHLVEGPHAVAEALRAGLVLEVFAAPGTLEQHPELAVPAEVPVTEVATHVVERITDATTPQGVVALASSRETPLSEVVGDGLLVVLDAVSDPGNLGTVVRTADAVGATGVVVSAGSTDPYSPKAVRAAAGSTYHLPLVVGVELPEVVAACHDAGQRVLGLDGAATTSVFDVNLSDGPLALVLGNEAHGLDPLTVEQVDALVAVPIHGQAESLNVAAAAAVAMYAVQGSSRPHD